MARRKAVAHVEPVSPDGLPAELCDAEAPVWHDRGLYVEFMAARGWDLPAPERLGAGTHPANRRNYAADAWGVENGVTTSPGHADWHRLRELGSIE